MVIYRLEVHGTAYRNVRYFTDRKHLERVEKLLNENGYTTFTWTTNLRETKRGILNYLNTWANVEVGRRER